jgi:hypothetical protein
MDAIYNGAKTPPKDEDYPNILELVELKDLSRIEREEAIDLDDNETDVTYLKRVFGSDLNIKDKGKKIK